MLGDRRWLFFLLVVFVRGTGGAFIHHYLMVYMAELGASATLRGAALAVATVSELAAFFYAHRLIARIGAERVILVSITATAVRLFLHFLIHAPAAVLAVQLLHGVTFSIFLAAGVKLANDLAPPGMETTAQGLFTATNFGAGGIVGAYVGGELLDLVGVHRMYLAASIGTFAGLAIFLFYRRYSALRRAGP
jgi:PPP family 3-phenylpropionic acid transporter